MAFQSTGTGLECCFAIPFMGVWSLLMVRSLRFYWQEAPVALQRWAEENGYKLVHRERRFLRRGPFWASGRGRVVYRISIRDRSGQPKSGWAGIGMSFWRSANKVEVRWDEPRPEPPDPSSEPTRGNPLMWDKELDS